VPEEQAKWAFRNGHLMRGRFSSADLLNFMGWLDDDFVDEVFAEYHRLVDEETTAASSWEGI
jgi:hypothetical protein